MTTTRTMPTTRTPRRRWSDTAVALGIAVLCSPIAVSVAYAASEAVDAAREAPSSYVAVVVPVAPLPPAELPEAVQPVVQVEAPAQPSGLGVLAERAAPEPQERRAPDAGLDALDVQAPAPAVAAEPAPPAVEPAPEPPAPQVATEPTVPVYGPDDGPGGCLRRVPACHAVPGPVAPVPPPVDPPTSNYEDPDRTDVITP